MKKFIGKVGVMLMAGLIAVTSSGLIGCGKKVANDEELRGVIRRSVKNFIFKSTKKNPMIIPVVVVA